MKSYIWFLIVCFLLIGTGIIWGIHDFQKKHGLQPDEILEALGFKKSGDVSYPVKSVTSVRKAEKLLSEAETAFCQLNFKEAAAMLESISGKQLPTSLSTKINDLKQKSSVFAELISDIAPDEIAPLEEMVEVKLKTGKKTEGRLIEETSQFIRLDVNGLGLEIPLNQIADYKKVPVRRRLSQLKKEYQERRDQLGSHPSSLDYWQLGTFCYKYQLKDDMILLFEKALRQDVHLLATVKEEKARRLYETYQWCVQHKIKSRFREIETELLRKYPDSKYAELVRQQSPFKTSSKETKPPDETYDMIKPTDSRIKKIVDEANKYFDKGMKHLKKTFERGPDFDEENERANALFRKAIPLYEQALEIDPDNQRLQDYMREVMQCLQIIRKQARHR